MRKPSDLSAETHQNAIGRATVPLATSNRSWWINAPREGWGATCDEELKRLRETRFGRHQSLTEVLS